ncbi:MAG: DUF1614 domain-containing protein [Leptolyngbya sp. SIO1E4]|nr:DUF1614 domain-containing protein [Leptolyngbya sp. SIO1E4]
MIYLPVTFILFLAIVLLLPLLLLGIAIDIVEVAVAKLGFSSGVAFWLFAAVIVGSTINIPLYRRKAEITIVSDFADFWLQQFWGIPLQRIRQEIVVALNVGGGLIPVLLALYQFTRSDAIAIMAVIIIVTIVSYFSVQIVPGIGIQMNGLVGPLTAALSAVLIAGNEAPAVAFAGGILGVLIGADLLHLREIERMASGVLSIGGAGVFDGIALCGLFALLLT